MENTISSLRAKRGNPVRRDAALDCFVAFLLAMTVFVGWAAPAQALKVANCDQEPRTVQIDFAGTVEEIVLQPGEHRRFFAMPTAIGVKETGIHNDFVRFDDEYCIRDGKPSIQKRGSLKRR